MGENSILKGRHYMQLFILAILFMFAIFTRKSIWIYYVRCAALPPTRLSPRPVGRVPLVLVPRRFPLILRRCREEGGGGWSCVWLWWVQ